MKDWWDNLEGREQVIVLAGGLFVIVAILYAFVWLPFDRNHQQLATNVSNWEQSLAELRPLRGAVASSGQAGGVITSSNQAPIIIVDQTLRSRGIEQFRRRSQPTTSNGIRV